MELYEARTVFEAMIDTDADRFGAMRNPLENTFEEIPPPATFIIGNPVQPANSHGAKQQSVPQCVRYDSQRQPTIKYAKVPIAESETPAHGEQHPSAAPAESGSCGLHYRCGLYRGEPTTAEIPGKPL